VIESEGWHNSIQYGDQVTLIPILLFSLLGRGAKISLLTTMKNFTRKQINNLATSMPIYTPHQQEVDTCIGTTERWPSQMYSRDIFK